MLRESESFDLLESMVLNILDRLYGFSGVRIKNVLGHSVIIGTDGGL